MTYKLKENSENRCLECGEVISFGRTDKKFCCEKCKNTYHNRRAKTTRNFKLKVMNALDHNYTILEKLIYMKIDSIELPELQMMGYKLEYVTSYHKNRTHNEYWCYDIKYFMTDNRIFSIRKVVPLAVSSVRKRSRTEETESAGDGNSG